MSVPQKQKVSHSTAGPSDRSTTISVQVLGMCNNPGVSDTLLKALKKMVEVPVLPY